MNILSSRSHLWGPASARNTMFVLVTCLVLVGCLGCASTQSKYNEAAKTGTVDAYQQFISEHPESPLAASARMNIEKIAWGEALKTETVAGYERFKRSYPATEYPVDRKIEEFHWISAKGENSQKAIEAFIEQYPQGSHAAEAQRWLDVERDWRQLERNPELEALQGFVRTHGENRYSERAAELVETIEQEQAIRESLSVVSLKTSSKPINWEKSRSVVMGVNGGRLVSSWEQVVEEKSPASGNVFMIGHFKVEARTNFECDMSSDVGLRGKDGIVYRSFAMVVVPKKDGEKGEGEVGWTDGGVQTWQCRSGQGPRQYLVCFEVPREAAAGSAFVFFDSEYTRDFVR